MTPSNTAASVKQRLLNLAKTRGEEFQFVLTRYGLERLLVRLALSEHKEQFMLKGAMLFGIWTSVSHRPTKDIDLRGTGEPNLDRLVVIFKDICGVIVPEDGLTFSRDSVKASRIREEEEYEGVRVTLEARLDSARCPIQVDIGFGDVVTPGPVSVELPTLLTMQPATLKAYNRETVIAEKFQAMVNLGMTNSRLKDFYDLWFLIRNFSFEGEHVRQAVQATFQRRRTAIPSETPLALTKTFSQDSQKSTQWRAFIKRTKVLSESVTLDSVVTELNVFFAPLLTASQTNTVFRKTWQPAGPWTDPP